jgi:hypothetical protein
MISLVVIISAIGVLITAIGPGNLYAPYEESIDSKTDEAIAIAEMLIKDPGTDVRGADNWEKNPNNLLVLGCCPNEYVFHSTLSIYDSNAIFNYAEGSNNNPFSIIGGSDSDYFSTTWEYKGFTNWDGSPDRGHDDINDWPSPNEFFDYWNTYDWLRWSVWERVKGELGITDPSELPEDFNWMDWLPPGWNYDEETGEITFSLGIACDDSDSGGSGGEGGSATFSYIGPMMFNSGLGSEVNRYIPDGGDDLNYGLIKESKFETLIDCVSYEQAKEALGVDCDFSITAVKPSGERVTYGPSLDSDSTVKRIIPFVNQYRNENGDCVQTTSLYTLIITTD